MSPSRSSSPRRSSAAEPRPAAEEGRALSADRKQDPRPGQVRPGDGRPAGAVARSKRVSAAVARTQGPHMATHPRRRFMRVDVRLAPSRTYRAVNDVAARPSPADCADQGSMLPAPPAGAARRLSARALAVLPLWCIALALGACASSPPEPTAIPVPITDFKMVAGRWQGSVSGLAGPRNEGDSVQVTIGEDGTYDFGIYRTIGVFGGKGQFTLQEESSWRRGSGAASRTSSTSAAAGAI